MWKLRRCCEVDTKMESYVVQIIQRLEWPWPDLSCPDLQEVVGTKMRPPTHLIVTKFKARIERIFFWCFVPLTSRWKERCPLLWVTQFRTSIVGNYPSLSWTEIKKAASEFQLQTEKRALLCDASFSLIGLCSWKKSELHDAERSYPRVQENRSSREAAETFKHLVEAVFIVAGCPFAFIQLLFHLEWVWKCMEKKKKPAVAATL